jgi:hypothetical protein
MVFNTGSQRSPTKLYAYVKTNTWTSIIGIWLYQRSYLLSMVVSHFDWKMMSVKSNGNVHLDSFFLLYSSSIILNQLLFYTVFFFFSYRIAVESFYQAVHILIYY